MSSKNDSNTNDTTNTPTGFLSHLIEMRDRLLRVVIVVGVAFIALFPFATNIYDFLAAPLARGMISIDPVAPFLVPMKLALMVAFLITLPYLFYQLWSFVAPGLYKHEKRLIYPLLGSSVFLFYLGIFFVYFILLPMMFTVIPQFVPETAEYKPDIGRYLDFTIMMFMAFGFGFEMPIATILLISTGMTTAEDLKKKRPYVIVGAFVVGMLLTPPDVISQIMLAIPMWILFELGLFFSKFFKVRVKEASEARDSLNKDDLTEAEMKTAAATSGTSAALTADKLWEDDDYIFEEDDENEPSNEDISENNLSDEERSILNKDPLDEELYDDDYLPDEENKNTEVEDNDDEKFFDNDDFHEMSDEEMETELDRIEADEMADELVEEKAKERAEEKAKQEKENDKNKK